jgi:uncharacterized protein YbjT (DUF2867 family)
MDRPVQRSLVVTGATGYLGRPVTALAIERGQRGRAFVRPGSESRVAAGAAVTTGDPFASDALAWAFARGDTLVHLIGTPRPSPSKARQFLDVDLVSIRAAATAAVQAGIAHIDYVSVAQPAPVMRAHVAARKEGESLVHATAYPRRSCALVRARAGPQVAIRAGAERLGPVTHGQMMAALMSAVERRPARAGVVDVAGIRAARMEDTVRPRWRSVDGVKST